MAFEGAQVFPRLTEYTPNFRADARRFELITLPFQDFYGFTSSVDLLLEIGIRDIAEFTRTLHAPLLKWADAHDVPVLSPREAKHRSAILCIAPGKAVDAF